MEDIPIKFDKNTEDLFKKEVIDIIDCIVEDKKYVDDRKLEQDIYEYIMLDVHSLCRRLAKDYMKENGIVLAVDYRRV